MVRELGDAVTPTQPPLSSETSTAAIGLAEADVTHAVVPNDATFEPLIAERVVDRASRGLAGSIGEICDKDGSDAALRARRRGVPGGRRGRGLAGESASLSLRSGTQGMFVDGNPRFRQVPVRGGLPLAR